MTRKEISAKWRKNNKDRIKEINSRRDYSTINSEVKKKNKKNPQKYLWRTARRRANKYGREFTIKPEDIHIPEICPVLGLPLITLNDRIPAYNSASIDRKDNSLGYTPDNIIVISYRANTLKKDATIDELKAIITYMQN